MLFRSNDTATTEIYTLSLHDALPILAGYRAIRPGVELESQVGFYVAAALVRIAASLVELWPVEGKVVPQIAAEALRQLK